MLIVAGPLPNGTIVALWPLPEHSVDAPAAKVLRAVLASVIDHQGDMMVESAVEPVAAVASTEIDVKGCALGPALLIIVCGRH